MQNEIEILLKELDIPYREITHAAVFTVAESLDEMEDKFPVKSLLLVEKGEGRKFLVIVPGQERLDIKGLSVTLQSKKLSFANEQTLKDVLNITPGSVGLFCLLFEGSKDVEVVVNERLLNAEEIGFHPNDNTATVFLPGSSITQIIEQCGNRLHVISG